MRLMASFFSAYKLQTSLMLLALILSGMAEGVGLSALLPLLNVAIGQDSGAGLGVAGAEIENDFERWVLEALASAGIEPTLGNLLLIIVLGITFKAALLLVAQRQVGFTAAQMGTDLRLQMLRAILRSKWEYFLHQPVGKLTNSLATEAQRSSDAFLHGATAITFLVGAFIYCGIAFALSWRASLAAVAAGALVIGASHFLVLIARKAGRKQTTLLTSLMAGLTDTLNSVKPLKAMAREHLADTVLAETTTRLNKTLRRQVLSAAVLDAGQELMFATVICGGIYIALELYGIELTTVMVLVVTLGRGFSYLGKVQKQYQKLAQAESAYWSMRESIDAASSAREELTGGRAPCFEKGICFSDVAFRYDHHSVFNQLSLSVETGTLTTLIGPSGSGKTTIIDLTIGLLRPTEGDITLDGVPLAELDIKAWRDMIGYVPQETVLLHDSIAHNVTLGDSQLTEQDVERALREAEAWEFVSRLPQGIHTIVGERGGKLSGGQRQRIAIARALVNRPRLLILDEATSALDPDSEQAIRETMEHLKGQLTILAISHNRAMVEAADHVYQLGDGGAQLLTARQEQTSFK